ncbi:MAG: 4Fe-4S binding protein [Dehalococcoidia bacterium]
MAKTIAEINHKKCIDCGLCVKACPPRAMILYF